MKQTRILFFIVLAQFCCTSVWFAGNAVMSELQSSFGLSPDALGYLTSSVQAGFITGTLIFALLTLADRFSPSKVFGVSALAAAALNAGILIADGQLIVLLICRFLTGFALAGIYPVGMKIAADYHDKGLGKALGFLVGALVLGTAFPHLVKTLGDALPWETVIYVTSGLALLGGLSIYVFVPDGPFRKAGKQLDLTVIFKVFQNQQFRSAALGYFGHMWELYAFWAFVPVFIQYSNNTEAISLWSFLVIGIGSLGCVAGGYVSGAIGSKKVALLALIISGGCCLLSPFFDQLPDIAFFSLLIVWGVFVIMDSPQFSTMVAQAAPSENTGSALTIVNCIGFLLTIFSIQLLTWFSTIVDPRYMFLLLLPGPILGVFGARRA